MKSLIGVECVECRRKGHHCQAQMWDGKKPVCLRCADGEPCYRVTAEGLPSPERYEDRAVEASFVLEERPRPPRPRKVEYVLPTISESECQMIRRQLETLNVEKVAQLHCMDPWTVSFIRDARVRASKPVEVMISEEFVRMAPMAVMGAEMLASTNIKPTIDAVQEVVAAHFGCTIDQMKGHKRTPVVVKSRHAGMYLARICCGMTLTDVGRFFGGRHYSTIFHGVEWIEQKRKEDAGLNKFLIEALQRWERVGQQPISYIKTSVA